MKRKYPVTAPSGRVYEVTVERNYVCLGMYGYEFRAYMDVEKRTLFGRIKKRRVCVNETSYWERDVTDFVELAQKCVMQHERIIAEEEARFASEIEFDAWDGRIRK